MNESTVLQNIRTIREIKNFRQNFVAQELDLSPRAYSKIEIKLEELLGFDYKTIFTNCDKSENHNTYTFDQNLLWNC